MKNLHIEHPEDSILTGDLSVLNWFTEPGHLSVKIDGCPAIVCGTDPDTGSFFVGTKSVFNKKKMMIAHSHEEIDTLYKGQVASILHVCFNYLPRTNSIIQGDFIGLGGHRYYTPNTITYEFPEIINDVLIIAPHTEYYAYDELKYAVAYPLETELYDDGFVKFVKPNAYILHHQESFADVEEVCSFARQMAQTATFVDEKGATHLKKCFNTFIRNGAVLDDNALQVFGNCDINLIRLWKLVKSIKEDCLFLCRNDGPKAYIDSEQIDAEGYVMSNQYGTYKLVNRSLFSHANFNKVKVWDK